MPTVAIPAYRPARGFSAAIRQFTGSVGTEFFGVVKSTSFIVILIASLLNLIPSLIFSASEGYGNHSLPVHVLGVRHHRGNAYLFLIGIVTYYAGSPGLERARRAHG